MSLWRAVILQKDFCALGDVYSSKYAVPEKYTVLVKKKEGVVVHPTSFSRVWDDHGSKGDHRVTVYKMNAPDGYSCIGGAAVGDYNVDPDKKHYCCIRNDHLVEGQYDRLYTDYGTKAHGPLSLWAPVEGAHPSGLDAEIFVPTANRDGGKYVKPTEKPWMLDYDHVTVQEIWSVNNPPKKPLDLYEVTEDLEKIWWDQGGYHEHWRNHITIYRATSDPENGYYSVGDAIVPWWNNMNMAFLLKTTDKHDHKSFALPISYTLIWAQDHPKLRYNIRIFEPKCPVDYVSLGYAAMSRSSRDPPPEGTIYCVHSDHVTYGDNQKNLKRVWYHYDVQIFQAISNKDEEQGIQTMFATVEDMPKTPWFLKRDAFNYIAEKPVIKVEIYDVEYDLDGEEKTTNPEELEVTYVINKSDSDQVCTRKVDYSSTKTTSFSFSYAVHYGISCSIELDVPLFAKETTTIGADTTMQMDTGEEVSEEKTDSVSAAILVPTMKKVKTTINGRKYTANIPYKAQVKKTYYDGTSSFGVTSGIFNGVEVSEVIVEYGATLDLTEEDLAGHQDDSPKSSSSNRSEL